MVIDAYVRANGRTTQESSLLAEIRIRQRLLRCRTYRTLAAQRDPMSIRSDAASTPNPKS